MYRPNFCAECGERIARERRRRWWASEKFCAVCEKSAAKANRASFRLAGAALLVFGAALISYEVGKKIGARVPAHDLVRAERLAPTSGGPVAVKTPPTNAAARPGDLSDQPIAPTYLCGARTQKGKPCSRRVRGAGERCWQHAGKRAMLPPEKLIVRESG